MTSFNSKFSLLKSMESDRINFVALKQLVLFTLGMNTVNCGPFPNDKNDIGKGICLDIFNKNSIVQREQWTQFSYR